MAYNYRGRRVAYDNVAVGSVAGFENHIPVRQTSGNTSDDVSTGVSDVSVQGSALEAVGSISNIAVGSSGGIEDNTNADADKFTSDGETITNTPSVD
jgi:hypothetical protein